ncbi:DUF3489 domain-containing protein [Xanthomonas albilineans]|uniref:DUF3489 domain-containing protein n=1 Tax=Xanthomonas albilineans TaxID=29447 RepID=UPI0005F30BEC|nr:DUF3489 domain-containing protein [Xanthomonas albilineans]
MTTQLTPAQHAILAHAHQYTEGKITWFPGNLNGSARKKVLDSMVKRALIKQTRNAWNIAAEGYKVLGVSRKAPISVKAIDAVIEQAKPRTRENSKQAQVIAMLKRPEGATIAQICEETGWQSHTVRGTFAGAFKKKLGLSIISDKAPGGDRIYRVE